MLFQSVFFEILSHDSVATLIVREHITAKQNAPIRSLSVGFRIG